MHVYTIVEQFHFYIYTQQNVYIYHKGTATEMSHSQFLETTHMSITSRIHEEITLYSYNGKLHSKEDEWSTTTLKNTDKSHKHYIERKKSDTEGYIVLDSFYVKVTRAKLLLKFKNWWFGGGKPWKQRGTIRAFQGYG